MVVSGKDKIRVLVIIVRKKMRREYKLSCCTDFLNNTIIHKCSLSLRGWRYPIRVRE